MYNVSYPEVKLKKTNAAGTGLEGVKFKITKTDGSQITDPDGKIISNASDGYYVTTGLNGETDVFSLPVGSYKVEEVEIPGRTEEQTDVLTKYFDLLNTTTITLKNDGTTNVFTFTNPDLGRLEVTKVNEKGEGIEGVPFAVQFKAFAAKDEWDAQSTADSGFAKPAWVEASYTTDGSGKISLSGLVPGWYKLIETVPDGYVGAGTTRSTIVKVTAQGMGQTGATAAAEAEIENVRKGTLKITKSFAQTGLAQIPETLTFNVYKESTGGTPVNQLDLTFGNGGVSATGSIALDPGTYYIEEAAQGWYAQYSINGQARNG